MVWGLCGVSEEDFDDVLLGFHFGSKKTRKISSFRGFIEKCSIPRSTIMQNE